MFLLLWTFVVCIIQVEGLKIGAFNIQTLGPTKYGKQDVMSYIDQILRRYDIVLVQEIRDASGVVIPGILERLRSNGEEWDVKVSDRLGRSSYKEQYAFYYRPDRVTVESSYQYDDGVDDGTDAFSREPFGILVNSDVTGGLTRFGLLGIHIAPDEAVAEVNALVDVFMAAQQHWQTEDVMIVGDFNADCSYVNSEQINDLDLRTDESYTWLIGDHVDTTVSSTDCAYDRMVLTGDLLKAAVDTNSAQEFRYDEVYNLDSELAHDISDHYPVEVDLVPVTRYMDISSFTPTQFTTTKSSAVKTSGTRVQMNSLIPDLQSITDICSVAHGIKASPYAVACKLNSDSSVVFAEAVRKTCDVLYDLNLFMSTFPGLVSAEVLDLVTQQLPLLESVALLNSPTSVPTYEIAITCYVGASICTLQLQLIG